MGKRIKHTNTETSKNVTWLKTLMNERRQERAYFQTIVEIMRRDCSPEHFYNHYPWHSRIVLDNIIKFAIETKQEIVRLFFSDYGCEFYGVSFISAIKNLVDNSCKVDIILAEPPDKSQFATWDMLTKLDRVSIRMMSVYDPELCHLCVTGNAYRVENPHFRWRGKVSETYPQRSARFSFGNKRDARLVTEYWHNRIEPKATLALAMAKKS